MAGLISQSIQEQKVHFYIDTQALVEMLDNLSPEVILALEAGLQNSEISGIEVKRVIHNKIKWLRRKRLLERWLFIISLFEKTSKALRPIILYCPPVKGQIPKTLKLSDDDPLG